MLQELELLLDSMELSDCNPESFREAIVEHNVLGKRSGKTRTLTFRHLVDLYALDPSVAVFRGLLHFWQRDTPGRPQLALLCVYARDPVFKLTGPFMQRRPVGSVVSRETVEEIVASAEQDRFSPATLKSIAQNINSSWTKSGHLKGKVKKVRTESTPTPGSVAYALFLAYISGGRGRLLFQSDFIGILDCPYSRALELAEEASRKGWIIFKRIGDVIDVQFPGIIREEEMGWLREQS